MFKKLKKVLLSTAALVSFSMTLAFADGVPSYTPGLCTIKNFLSTALQPVGQTMYIWSGGWNETETGPGKTSVTIGLFPKWRKFYEEQAPDYNFLNYVLSRKEEGGFFPKPDSIENGLDCSGYVGWAIYNVLNTENNNQSYVYKAKLQAKILAEEHHFGEYKDFGKIEKIKSGDIISISNSQRRSHVYIALGQCSDGSVVTLESAPPGVRILVTQNHAGSYESEAVKLATNYMSKYYPEWYAKFTNCICKSDDYRNDSQMSWEISEDSIMKDPEGYRNMTPEEVLQDLFNEK